MSDVAQQLDLRAVARKEAGIPDVEAATILADSVHDQLMQTAEGTRPDDDRLRAEMRTLRLLLVRLNIDHDLRFHSFWEVVNENNWWWLSEYEFGPESSQIREARQVVTGLFRFIYLQLEALDLPRFTAPVGTLAGWSSVESLEAELRERFAGAKTTNDLRAIGDLSISLLREVGMVAFDAALHGDPDQDIPAPNKYWPRIELILGAVADGPRFEALRGFARKANALAQGVRHQGETGDGGQHFVRNRLEAQIAINACLSVAVLVRAVVADDWVGVDPETPPEASVSSGMLIGPAEEDIPF